VDTFINEKLGVEVEYLNPFERVYVGDAIGAEVIEGDAHMMSEIVGLALREAVDCPIELDLIPPYIKSEKEFQKKIPILVGCMALLVLTLFGWALFFMSKSAGVGRDLAAKQSQVADLKRYTSQIESVVSHARGIEDTLGILDERVDDRKTFIDILAAIRSQMPAGAWLTRVETDLRDLRNPQQGEKEPSDVIQFQGLFYKDTVKPDQIKRDLIQRLNAMDLFSEASIVKIPTDDRLNLQSYWIKVTLNDRLPR